MKLKKLLAAILCVAMVLSTISTAVFASDTTVDSFDALKAAIMAAQEGDEITLTADIEKTEISRDYDFEPNVAITINLNGNTLSLNGDNLFSSDLTIKNGTVEVGPQTSTAFIWMYDDADLIMDNVTFNAEDAKGYSVISGSANGTITFKDSIINVGDADNSIADKSEATVVADARSLSLVNTDISATNVARGFVNCVVDIDADSTVTMQGNSKTALRNVSGVIDGTVSITGCDYGIENDGTQELNCGANAVITISDSVESDILVGADASITIDPRAEVVYTSSEISGDVAVSIPNSFEIATYEELVAFAELVNAGDTCQGKVITLTADIDLNNQEWTPIGNSTNKFQGIFDGNGHTISNLKINSTSSYIGLFGYTINGEIKNLNVHNADIDGRLGVGVVSGCPYTSKYTNITVTGHVTIDAKYYVGGVVGRNAYADLTNITVDVDDTSYVKANSVDVGAGENGEDIAYRTYVGGVVGFIGEGSHTISNITSNIDVYGSTCDVGGIAGIAHYGNNFENVTCSGNVYLEDENENEVGGIAGVWNNNGSPVAFENCSFTGTTYIAGEPVKTAISGPGYSEDGTGDLTITAKVTLNGVEKETLEQAITEAKEMTEPAVIDLLGNNATINKAYVLNNDITFKNGMLIFNDFNGLDPDTYDPAGIYYAVMTIGANVTFDNCILTGRNVTANTGVFVLTSNGVMALTNGSELNVIKPTATAVIYSEAGYNGKLVVDNSKINIDGKDNAVRGMLALEIDADDAEITVKNITDNAMRNVKGNIDNSTVIVDAAEYGIKNKDFNEILTVNNSSISITNTTNEDGNAGIYLYSRENLADTSSTINAKFYVSDGISDPVVYYTLNLESNGGSEFSSVLIEENAIADLSGYKPEKSGYRFYGWFSDEALTQNVTSVTMDDNKTVYAKWLKKGSSYSGGSGVTKYTVTFDTDGGSAVARVYKAPDTVVDLSAYTTSKEGYTFDGWYSDNEFTTKVTSIKLTESITVYAKWIDEEKVDDTDKPDSTGWNNPFADVNADDWYYEYVRYAAENNLMNGMTETTFAPDNNLTRAMLVTVLYRLAGEPATNRSIPFADIDMGAYYANAVIWAQQNGIVNGVTETEFAPDANITREQIAAIMFRYAVYKDLEAVTLEENLIVFADADEISEYAISALNWAVGSGLINGKTESALCPRDNANRAEIAAILQRFIESNK